MAESVEVTLDSLIGEYLQHQGFSSTFALFIEECKLKSRPLSAYVTETLESKINDAKVENWNYSLLQAQMMSSFDSGDAERFFENWKKYIPSGDSVGETPGHKVEFYAYIYFAIYPVHSISKKQVICTCLVDIKDKKSTLEAGMMRFRKFIETKGSDLSNTPTFLPFYALPFVGDPSIHPSFKELFQVLGIIIDRLIPLG